MKPILIIISTLFLASDSMLAQDTIPPFSLGNDTTLCLGEYIALSGNLPLFCSGAYIWNDDWHDPIKIVTKPGTYWVDVTSQCGTFQDTIHISFVPCQSGCASMNTIAGIYTSPNTHLRGNSLVSTPENDGFYVAGFKNDSVFIAKADLAGNIIWTRTFEIISGGVHYVNSMVIDTNGIIAIAGTFHLDWAGIFSVFMFRYDPKLNQVVWAKQYNVEHQSHCFSMHQKPFNGNYLISLSTADFLGTISGGAILEVNKNSGDIVRVTTKDEIVLHDFVVMGNFIFGAGGYHLGSENFNRQSLIKLDITDGTVEWHKAGERLHNVGNVYAPDLLISENNIYSIYSDVDNKLHVQKTTLDGSLIWLKHYDIPGRFVYANEIIKSGNGFIIYGQIYDTQELFLIKIDTEGSVVWAKTYYTLTNYFTFQAADAVNQVIEVANEIVFTSFSIDSLNQITDPYFDNLIIGRTNLTGNIISSCVSQRSLTIPVHDKSNPTFFSVPTSPLNVDTVVHSFTPAIIESIIIPKESCVTYDTIYDYYSASICEGEFFEGYATPGVYLDTFLTISGCDSIRVLVLTQKPNIINSFEKNICSGSAFEGYHESGIYSDTFNLSSGCDSIRTLQLNVLDCVPIVYYDLDACESIMSNGSHMDYTEFVPSYPSILNCADISASYLSRIPPQENKHSCTPGINNSPAMCVSTLNSCEYITGHTASVVIEFSIDPYVDSLVQITGLEFYEKGPFTYNWINGPSGPNNYPRFYAIRILKNGIEIFKQLDIQTNPDWTLQSYDFLDDSLFRVEEHSDFRIELLPYCPVGNGAEVSAWDLDEIKIFGGCIPVPNKKPVIIGEVLTKDAQPIPSVEMQLAENAEFINKQIAWTDEFGAYQFTNLEMGDAYYVKGYKNDDALNGVSTLDLILIQRHLLGINPFTSLDQYIAADVNKSGKVSVIDLLALRKLILGINSVFPHNTSWRFGSLPQDMNVSDISKFKEVTNIEYLEKDTQVVDFIGIKVGDLNGDVQIQIQSPGIDYRNRPLCILAIKDKEIDPDIPFIIEFKSVDHLIISGMQFALDLNGMEIVSLKGINMSITPENYSIIDGILRFSWCPNEIIHVFTNDVIITIVLKALEGGLISDKIKTFDQTLLPEVYLENLEVMDLYFKIINNDFISRSGNFLKIEPNPVSSEANIHFYLKEGGLTEFRFIDLSGNVLCTFQKNYLPGEYIEKIESNEFYLPEGLIYCQLISNGFTCTEKFIKLY